MSDNKHKIKNNLKSKSLLKLSFTDQVALENENDEYFLSKGLYADKNELSDLNLEDSIHYLEISAILGNNEAILAIGHMYRDIDQIDLALLYYKLAAKKGNADAYYELYCLYNDGEEVRKDRELAGYYLKTGIDMLYKQTKNDRHALHSILQHPDLLYAGGIESMPDGELPENIDIAHHFLLTAKHGYQDHIYDNPEYALKYAEVSNLLEDDIFEPFRDEDDEWDDDLDDFEDEDDEFIH